LTNHLVGKTNIKNKNKNKHMRKSISRAIKQSSIFALALMLLVGINASASNQSELSQTISDGSLSVDIVDGAGSPVASPSVTFGGLSFSFSTQDGTGTLGTASEQIRAYNPTSGEVWSVNMAATSGATALWNDGGSNDYDFNDSSSYTDGGDADGVGGQLNVDPLTSSSIAGVGTCTTTNVSAGTADAFDEGTTDSIDLMSAAAGSDQYCRWDMTGIDLLQEIPAAQVSGTYTIDMTMSIS
jgi:hypothetical protein